MMRMSTKGHHATRILMHLATSPAGPVTKTQIGEAEAISPGYVQQLMTTLTDAGIVRSHRGKMGGFTLARPAEEITVRQVIQVTEGPFELSPCVDASPPCPRATVCAAHQLWMQATAVLNDLFDNTTIADLVARGHELEEQAAVAASA